MEVRLLVAGDVVPVAAMLARAIPGRQGQGVGAALLRPMLERCDARREPAYLESSNERNLTFYRRHGFDITGEVVTHLGPKAWLMWREPR